MEAMQQRLARGKAKVKERAKTGKVCTKAKAERARRALKEAAMSAAGTTLPETAKFENSEKAKAKDGSMGMVAEHGTSKDLGRDGKEKASKRRQVIASVPTAKEPRITQINAGKRKRMKLRSRETKSPGRERERCRAY